MFIEPAANTHKNARTQKLENTEKGVEPHGEDRERHQCGYAAAGQDAIVDLQHEHRARQHQHVDDKAEQPESGKGRATAGKGAV